MNWPLTTERLNLQPYEVSQAERVTELAGDKAVAATTFVPHPYTLEDAQNWIRTHEEWIKEGKAYPMAMVLKSTNELVGTMPLPRHIPFPSKAFQPNKQARLSDVYDMIAEEYHS